MGKNFSLLYNILTANKKLSDMTAELSKAQEHARRFQEFLSAERRKQKSLKARDPDIIATELSSLCVCVCVCVSQHALEQEMGKSKGGQGAALSLAAQRAYVDSLTETLSPQSKSQGPARLDDIVRKNEV